VYENIIKIAQSKPKKVESKIIEPYKKIQEISSKERIPRPSVKQNVSGGLCQRKFNCVFISKMSDELSQIKDDVNFLTKLLDIEVKCHFFNGEFL
jgi:hypothetical protein